MALGVEVLLFMATTVNHYELDYYSKTKCNNIIKYSMNFNCFVKILCIKFNNEILNRGIHSQMYV